MAERILNKDVLVVGGGLAALSAAIESMAAGSGVILVDKGRVGASGSSPSSIGSFQAYLSAELGGHPADSQEAYLQDIVKGGRGLSHLEMAAILAEEAGEAILEAESWGVPFVRTGDGGFETHITSGMSHPRVGPVKGYGRAFLEVMRRETVKRGGELAENFMVTKLVSEGGRVIGAIGIHTHTGEPVAIEAKCTILAAGSALALYPYSSAAEATTGDAYALAWDLGVTLANMEFVEFTLIPAPRGNPFPSGGIKPTVGKGAVFYNGIGERFMAKYDPVRLELSERSLLVQAVYSENKAGHGPCWLDVSHFSEPTMPFVKMSQELGIDWRREKIPWVPAVHSFLGGVVIDQQCSTEVPGLYAAGETAGHGFIFGADRICGAVGACLVLGRRAGRNAAKEAIVMRPPRISETLINEEKERWQSLHHPQGRPPDQVRRDLQQVCQDCLGLMRSADEIQRGLDLIGEMENTCLQAGTTRELVAALETGNLILTAKLVALAALTRTESRGLHRRLDHPNADDSRWLKTVEMWRQKNRQTVRVANLPGTLN